MDAVEMIEHALAAPAEGAPVLREAAGARPTVSGVTIGQRVLFLAFVFAAFAIFAATMLLPMLRDYSRLLDEERLLRGQVTRLEDKKQQLQQLAISITKDPQTSERLARIELGYQRPGETIMPVETATAYRELDAIEATADADQPLIPAQWPAWAHEVEVWADQRGMIEPFLDRRLQSVWMLLAGGLVVAAFVLFAPRRPVSVNARS